MHKPKNIVGFSKKTRRGGFFDFSRVLSFGRRKEYSHENLASFVAKKKVSEPLRVVRENEQKFDRALKCLYDFSKVPVKLHGQKEELVLELEGKRMRAINSFWREVDSVSEQNRVSFLSALYRSVREKKFFSDNTILNEVFLKDDKELVSVIKKGHAGNSISGVSLESNPTPFVKRLIGKGLDRAAEELINNFVSSVLIGYGDKIEANVFGSEFFNGFFTNVSTSYELLGAHYAKINDLKKLVYCASDCEKIAKKFYSFNSAPLYSQASNFYHTVYSKLTESGYNGDAVKPFFDKAVYFSKMANSVGLRKRK